MYINMKQFIQEFKEFAMRGNVVDLAVGVIVGSAFGKIVSSLVSDIVMPPIGVLLGGVNFSELAITLKSAGVDTAGRATPPILLRYGAFIQALFDFAIIALAVFVMIKVINKLKRTEPKNVEEKKPFQKPEDVVLLEQIRDILTRK